MRVPSGWGFDSMYEPDPVWYVKDRETTCGKTLHGWEWWKMYRGG